VIVGRAVGKNVFEDALVDIPVNFLAEVFRELGSSLCGVGCAGTRGTGGGFADFVCGCVREAQDNSGEVLRHVRRFGEHSERATLVGVTG
jgi:hypothetical protein